MYELNNTITQKTAEAIKAVDFIHDMQSRFTIAMILSVVLLLTGYYLSVRYDKSEVKNHLMFNIMMICYLIPAALIIFMITLMNTIRIG